MRKLALVSCRAYGAIALMLCLFVSLLTAQARAAGPAPKTGRVLVKLRPSLVRVSGLAALSLSPHPEYSNEQVRQVIRASVTPLPAAKGTTGVDFFSSYGYGNINAAAAVALNTALEAKISSPLDGANVQGTVTISGVAQGNGFAQYRLEFGAGAAPSSWTVIQSGSTPVSGSLGAFNTTQAANGICTVRLTVLDSAGDAFMDRIEVMVNNIAITSPALAGLTYSNASAIFKPGVPISIAGTAAAEGFEAYRLEWAEGSAYEYNGTTVVSNNTWYSTGISLTGGGLAPVVGGQLGAWDTSGITTADYYTIRLSVDHAGTTSVAYTLVYLEPDLLSANWPQELHGVTAVGGPGIVPEADAAGNVHLTTVTSVMEPWWIPVSPASQFYAFSVDGAAESTVNLNSSGFSLPAAGNFDGQAGEDVVTGDGNDLRVIQPDNATYTFPSSAQSFSSRLPVILDDIGGDSQLEAITVDSFVCTPDSAGTPGCVSNVRVWHGDGTQLSGNFPIPFQVNDQLAQSYREGYAWIAGGALAGNVEGDGGQELVVTDYPSPKLYGSDGTERVWAAPAISGLPAGMMLVDLDQNGKLETVLATYNALYSTPSYSLHVLQPDGSERPGWPVTLNGVGTMSYGGYAASVSLAAGDLNQDGSREIVASTNTNIYVLNANGTPFSAAWPSYYLASAGPVVLADVDGDGYPEILASNNILTFPGAYNAPRLVAYRRDGTLARSWKLFGVNGLQASTPATITVGDFNHDGLTEIAVVYPLINPQPAPLVELNGETAASSTNSPSGDKAAVTVLATGVPYDSSVNDWPMTYQNPRNTAVLQSPPVCKAPKAAALLGNLQEGGSTVIALSGQAGVYCNRSDSLIYAISSPPAYGTASLSGSSVTYTPASGYFGSDSFAYTVTDTSFTPNRTSAPATVEITVSATGSAATVSPSSLFFSSQTVGTSSPAQTVTLASVGNQPLVISGMSTAGDFSQTNNCPSSLPPGNACQVQVTFNPTSNGNRTGTLMIVDNAPDNPQHHSPQRVALSGIGTIPDVSLAPSSLIFSAQPMGTTSAAYSVTIMSTGDQPLTIGSISVTGDFSQTNNCPTSLPPGSCLAQVTFTPTATGTRTGTLIIADNALNSSQQLVSLLGVGALPTTTSLTASPSTTTIGGSVTLTATISQNSVSVTGGMITFFDGPRVIGNAYVPPTPKAPPKGVPMPAPAPMPTPTIATEPLGTVQVVGPNPASGFVTGTAKLETRLAPGTHSLTASFSGFGSYPASVSAPATVTVSGKEPSQIVLSPSYDGKNYTFLATVSGASGATIGSIDLTDLTSGTDMGSAPLVLALPAAQVFLPRPAYPVGQHPVAVVAGDFNRDGTPDLAVGNSGDNTISILLGNGDGTFHAGQTYNLSDSPNSIVVADFNGDGILDLAVGAANSISILLGDPVHPGQFLAPQAFNAHGLYLAVADLNNDGIPDLFAGTGSSGTVEVSLGNGDGTFQSAQSYKVGSHTAWPVAIDINRDGVLDIAVSGNDFVNTLLGDPAHPGQFLVSLPNPDNVKSTAIVAGDFYQTGIPELAATQADDVYFLSWGYGTTQAQGEFIVGAGASPVFMATADLSGDGRLDLVTANSGTASVGVAIQDLTGKYGDAQTFPAYAQNYPVGNNPASVAVADFTGDEMPDMAVANANDNTVTILLNQTAVTTQIGTSGPLVGVGPQTLQATYTPDSTSMYAGSTSAKYTADHALAPSTLVLTASPSAVVPVSAAVSVTVTVEQVSGLPVPTGTIDWTLSGDNGDSSWGNPVLAGGSAVVSLGVPD